MSGPDLTLQLNFNAAYNCLDRDVTLALERLIVTLEGLEKITKLPPDLATSHRSDVPEMQIAARPLDVVRADTERWILANAFRDLIEEVSAFFEGLRSTDATLDLVGRTFTIEEFRATVEAPAGPFDRLTFPDKLDRLSARKVIPADVDLCLLGINRARNCLVHRRGIVGERDVDESGTLRMAWMRPLLVARMPDGREIPLRPGAILEGGAEVFVRMPAAGRAFRRGEAIQLTAEDVAGIWWTIRQIGQAATQLVKAKAVALGFTFDDEKEDAEPAPERGAPAEGDISKV